MRGRVRCTHEKGTTAVAALAMVGGGSRCAMVHWELRVYRSRLYLYCSSIGKIAKRKSTTTGAWRTLLRISHRKFMTKNAKCILLWDTMGVVRRLNHPSFSGSTTSALSSHAPHSCRLSISIDKQIHFSTTHFGQRWFWLLVQQATKHLQMCKQSVCVSSIRHIEHECTTYDVRVRRRNMERMEFSTIRASWFMNI